ncbi:hypothetical protein ACO0RG_003481 [Hanseniaspora osmophila]
MQAGKKLFITSAALATLTAAASNSTSSASVPSSCTVKNVATAQSDLDNLSSCSTIVGTLTIGDDLENPTLSNVQEIQGTLNVTGSSNIVSFSAEDLETITENLDMIDLTSILTISLPKLSTVGTINLEALPVVNSVVLTALDSANNVIISDTNLESLSGFENLENVNTFDINNNGNLVSIISTLKTVSNSLEITYNGDDCEIAFDDLKWANNITIRDASSVSFDSLNNVNSSIGFINNDIGSLKLDNMTTIGGSLVVVGNDNLTSVSFPELETIGGALVVANNSILKNISSFPQLTKINGALDIVGPFSSFSLPKLTSVKGGADVETNQSNFSCDALKSLQKKGGIQGDNFVCKAGSSSTSVKLSSTSSDGSATGSATATDSSSASATDSSSASSTSSKTSKSKGGAVNNNAAMGTFFGGLAAVAVALL